MRAPYTLRVLLLLLGRSLLSASGMVACYMHGEPFMDHMAVWMDGDEARIFHVNAKHFDEATVHSPKHHVHRHAKAQLANHSHPDDEHKFFREISQSLAGSAEILVLGPSVTKLHFLRYLQKHDTALEARIVGLETVGHPTDGQIVQHVRSYFGDSPHKTQG